MVEDFMLVLPLAFFARSDIPVYRRSESKETMSASS
jgi:hypothetical protein